MKRQLLFAGALTGAAIDGVAGAVVGGMAETTRAGRFCE